jgi:uncharacterized protein (DUF433 family)
MAMRQPNPFPRIVRDPRILSGEPIIRGTRISVRAVVLALQFDDSMEEVERHYSHVEREALEEAVAFHAANRAEIDRHIRQNQDETD